MTSLTIARIEDGANHHALTLQQLDRLADALATAPALLFTQSTTPVADADDQQVREIDRRAAALGRRTRDPSDTG